MHLTKLNGVGDAKAETLKEHGYDQLEDVAFANPVHLKQVPNVSRDLIEEAILEMQAFPAIGYRMDQKSINPDAQGKYWCEHCGQHFLESWILRQDEGRSPAEKQYHNCDPRASLSSTTRNGGSVSQ